MKIRKRDLREGIEGAYEKDGWAGVQRWLDEICADERVKLSKLDKDLMASAYRKGESVAEIAEKFEVSTVHARRTLGISSGHLELDPGLKLRPASK